MISLLQIFLSLALAAQAPMQFNTKVQSQVAHNFLTENNQDVLIFLKDSADLSSVRENLTPKERNKLVYDLLRTKALESQKSLVDYLKANNQDFRSYYITNMILVRHASAAVVAALSARSDVRSILSNPKLRNKISPVLSERVRNRTPGSNVVYTGAKRVWDELKIRGQNIVVAGQDTGVEWDHPALIKHYRGYSSDKVTHAYNWHDSVHNSPNNPCGSDISAPCDDHSHGTHTLGTVVGNDGGENEIGMAPDAKWMACRNMDAGVGRPATYIECFEFFLAPYAQGADPLKDGDPSKSPNVINNSWSCPEDEGCKGDEFLPVLAALEKAGIMVVVSAGNEGPDCGTIAAAPAHHSNSVLSVGAMDYRTGRIASFSSRGPSAFDGEIGPHVAAPGVDIRSSVPGKKYEEYGWSGTSMAGPHVVGQVALMWSANPKLIGHIQETKKIIEETAKKAGAQVSCGEDLTARPNNTFGYGIIDIYASVKKAMEYR